MSNSGPRLPSGDARLSGGPRPAAALGAEAGGDHRHPHLVLQLVVDHRAEDDVRVLVGRAGDHLGRLVHLEEARDPAGR